MDKKKALNRVAILEKELAELKTIIGASTSIFKVRNYSEVCKKLDEKELILSDFNHLPDYIVKKCLNYAKIKQLEKFFNEGWEPNWADTNEYKYYLWYKYKNGGWVFCGCYYYCCASAGPVGFYKTSNIANHIYKYFSDIYLNTL